MSITEYDAPPTVDQGIYDDPQLAIPGVDGYEIHRIGLKVGANLDLDRSNPDTVAVWRGLKLGQRVGLTLHTAEGDIDLAGHVVEAGGGKAQINDSGEVDHVSGSKTIKIDTVTAGP